MKKVFLSALLYFFYYTVSAQSAWTWLQGDAFTPIYGRYGTKGVANGVRFLNDIMKFSLSAALPVLFSSFRAQKQSGSVALYWNTAQEQNSRAFIIERSSEGIVFSPIGTVAAAGNSSSPSNYSFTDLTPLPGDNYYRLKEVDLDNKWMYSSVAKIHFGDKAAAFTILNNPAQHEVQVSLWLSSEQKVQVQIRDAGGRVLMARLFAAGKGTNLFRLPVSSLSKGTYFVQVQSQSVNGAKAFVKQ